MKIQPKAALAALLLCALTNPAQSNELIDTFAEEFLLQLSKNQGFNRIRAPGVGEYIGSAFYVEKADIKCSSELVPKARNGEALDTTLAINFKDTPNLPQPAPIRNWRSIRISSLITKGIEAEMSAKHPDKAAEIRAAASYFRKTNAQILFATRSVPAWEYRVAAKEKLSKSGIEKASDIEDSASGVVIPVSELLVQKFEFDSELARSTDLTLAAKFLSIFGGKVAGAESKNIQYGFTIPTNSVLAFKPISILFECNR